MTYINHGGKFLRQIIEAVGILSSVPRIILFRFFFFFNFFFEWFRNCSGGSVPVAR